MRPACADRRTNRRRGSRDRRRRARVRNRRTAAHRVTRASPRRALIRSCSTSRRSSSSTRPASACSCRPSSASMPRATGSSCARPPRACTRVLEISGLAELFEIEGQETPPADASDSPRRARAPQRLRGHEPRWAAGTLPRSPLPSISNHTHFPRSSDSTPQRFDRRSTSSSPRPVTASGP